MESQSKTPLGRACESTEKTAIHVPMELGPSKAGPRATSAAGSDSISVAPRVNSICNDIEDGWEALERDAKAEKLEEKTHSVAMNTSKLPPRPIQLPTMPPSSDNTTSPSLEGNTTPPPSQSTKKPEPETKSTDDTSSRPPKHRTVERNRVQPFRPTTFTSYRDLFFTFEDDYFHDSCVLLQPFNRLVYVTETTPSTGDFYRYAWLLAQSEERWYSMPSTSKLARMRKSGLEHLSPIENPRPASLAIPMIVASDVLNLQDCEFDEVIKLRSDNCNLLHPDDMSNVDGEDDGNGGNGLDTKRGDKENYVKDAKIGKDDEVGEDPKNIDLVDKDKKICERCYEKTVQIHNDVGWVYLSVVRTDMQHSSDRWVGNGIGMFMLRRHSCREQAVAQAFYDAGALGWSTLFCCAIRADVDLQDWKGRVKGVRYFPQHVLVPEEGVLRVLF